MAGSSTPPAWSVLVWLHRWTGIAVCLLFVLWFGSGIVMLFEPFPSLPAAERQARAEPFDAAAVSVAPAEALAALPSARALTLRSRDGRPVYLVQGETLAVIDAATGTVLPPVDAAAAMRISERFAASTAQSADLVTTDQWIVHEGFASGRPYYRVTMADPAGTQLYVSAASGEVRQRTTRTQRALNAVGAVPHWLYWTSIRQNWSLWDSLVWWVSLAALGSAMLGMAAGVYRYMKSRQRGGVGWKVFVSWWRWHHVLGLTAGVFVIGWILSGWLSMDHGRLFPRAAAPEAVQLSLEPLPVADHAERWPLAAVQAAGEGVQIRFRSLGMQSFVVVDRRDGGRVIVTGQGEQLSQLPDGWLVAAMQDAFAGRMVVDLGIVPASDLHGRAEELPATARRFGIAGPPELWIHVDGLTGELLAMQDPARRTYSWVYYALHTYRFPVLLEHENLRKALMMLPLLAGLALSLTGVVIGWRRLRSQAARAGT